MAKWTVRAIQVGSIDLDRSAMTHFKGNYSSDLVCRGDRWNT